MAIMEENNVVSLSGNIRKILGLVLSERDKEILIDRTFRNYHQINFEDCCEVTNLAFSMVFSPDNVSIAWCILENLEQSQPSCLTDLIQGTVRNVLTRTDQTFNVEEVPRFLKWCLKNGSTPLLEATIREKLMFFLKRAKCHDSVATSYMLGSLGTLLEINPTCIPTGLNILKEFCRVVVEKLAKVKLPLEPIGISKVTRNIIDVQKLLLVLANRSPDHKQILSTYLKFLYIVISDPANFPEPSPTLGIILQVVDTDLIHGSVHTIFAEHPESENLVRLTSMLCDWLVKWPRALCLNKWVLAIMIKLEDEGRLDVLEAVAQQSGEKLFTSIVLPVVRAGAIPVLLRMLPGHCTTPDLFVRVAPKIPMLIFNLRRENSQSSKSALQDVVNMSAACMRAFQGYRDLHGPIMLALQDCWEGEGIGISACAASTSLAQRWQSSTPSTLRIGLHNVGNTCYMNSILQALFMSHRFCVSVLQSEVNERSQPVLFTLQKLFVLLMYSHRPAVSAEHLLSLTRPPGFCPGYQQDSSEFLIHLLDTLHEQEKNSNGNAQPPPEAGDGEKEAGSSTQSSQRQLCASLDPAAGGEAAGPTPVLPLAPPLVPAMTASLTVAPSSLTPPPPAPVPMDEDEDEEDDDNAEGAAGVSAEASPQVPEQDTIVRSNFGGMMKTLNRCMKCFFESAHTDPFIELQVCFPEDDSDSDPRTLDMQALINDLLSPEELSGENRYRCDRCQTLQHGVRLLQVLNPPEHLILILKHFRYNPITRQRMKLMHKVNYAETVELPVSGPCPTSAKYRLYAAVIHAGRSVDAGHYYTITRDGEDNWLRMDDESVTASNSEELNRLRSPDTPYILFYCATSSSLLPARGSPEEPKLTELRSDLYQYVNHDNRLYSQEEEKHRNRRLNQSSTSLKGGNRRYGTDDDDDDQNLPGSSCGGQVETNTPLSRFVF